MGMKRILKTILTAAVLVAALTALTACSGGSSELAKATPIAGKDVKTITGSVTLSKTDDNMLKVDCTTDIMNGAKLRISIDSYEGTMLAYQDIEKTGDTFSATFGIQQDWASSAPIYANVVCMPKSYGKQPSEVREAYGDKFENIDGDIIIWNDEGNSIVITSEPINNI
jgi:hypothetical protein